MTREPQEDLGFRSLAAPGLDEDDLFAAMAAPSGDLLWGVGRPPAFAATFDGTVPCREEERRVRHREVLARWDVAPS